MSKNSQSAAYHFTGMGIKGETLSEDDFAKCKVCLRITDFEDGNNIETETDEGHTGSSNLKMSMYRSSAESEPSWTDKFRFKEGLEDYFYLLLGNYEKNPASPRFNFGGAGANHYAFSFPTQNAKDLPAATIYHGYAKTNDDARAFNNSFLNKMESSGSADSAPTLKLTFVSDYNNMNLANPTRNFLVKSVPIKGSQVTVYLGDTDLSLEELLEKKIDCAKEADWNVDNKFENIQCMGKDFGKNNKDQGEVEGGGSLKMPWNESTKKFEPEYEAHDKNGHVVSEETFEKQIIFMYTGGIIPGTDVNYRVVVHFPKINAKITSTKSGSDAKEISVEFDLLTESTQSYMYVDIWTDLEDLHIDEEGCDLDDLYYVEPANPNPSVTTYDLTFKVTDGSDPVDGATVRVGELTGTTDSSGEVTISNVPEGSANLTVSKDGFDNHTDTLTVNASTTVNVTLTASGG